MSVSTGGAVARGAVWMLLAKLGDRIAGIASIAITARYLSPSDFGTFQMALSVIAIVEVFSLLGFDWALVRHPNPTREHFDTAFTLQLIFSTCAGLIIFSLAYPFAEYYRTPELALIVMVTAVAPITWGLNNLALVHLRREFQFERDFWRMFMPRVAALVFTIALAITWQSYWALAGGYLAMKFTQLAAGYLLHPYRPRLTLVHWRELMSFSIWMQFSSVIDGIRMRIADLIVGSQYGSHSLAIYNMSTELSNLPQSEFVGALNTALFPKYGRMQDDVAQLRAAYVDILSLTFLVCLPVAVGLAFAAPSVVMLFLGSKWTEVVPVIQYVAFGALAGAIGYNTQYVLLTANRPNLNTVLAACSLALLAGLLIFLTAKAGILGAAIGFTIASIVVLPAHFLVLRLVIGLTMREIVLRVWRSVTAIIAMAIALHLVVPPHTPQGAFDSAIWLAFAGSVGGVVYLGTIYGLWVAARRPDGVEHLLTSAAKDISARVVGRFLRR